MADGTLFLAIAYVAMIGIIGGWTWNLLSRMNELSERLSAAEAALSDSADEISEDE
ncbi:MAG TPA: hypothetical protein QF802_04485 [Candidatus Thalassarchaeaceae archaeon]|nr:hypothetical protein [Candidatus Thalassarchaeaceae archaeon]HJL60241.1 hypothetical protein [Candidatus Thalassarchaeaceae archaeon]HJM19692.1 hypothetical protein [Candidatus Thalassarchaeaceae archaeon]